jgi:hypothetical protein
MSDLLTPHLLDILADSASNGLILGGGFGLNLKRLHLLQSGVVTLVRELPEARATTDLDFFLKLEVFANPEHGQAIRQTLDTLGYTEFTPLWQFSKPFDQRNPDQKVFVDLLARLPGSGDGIKVRSLRVGSRSDTGLHGRETPEAFSVEEQTISVTVNGTRTDGSTASANVILPHPYSWLNMKVRAAHDWLRWRDGRLIVAEDRRPPSSKHIFDASLIVAMMTEEEVEQAATLTTQFREHPVAQMIRQEAVELFATPTSLGWIETQSQAERAFEHELIWSTMAEMLGIVGESSMV